jgi:hypothetical protein
VIHNDKVRDHTWQRQSRMMYETEPFPTSKVLRIPTLVCDFKVSDTDEISHTILVHKCNYVDI